MINQIIILKFLSYFCPVWLWLKFDEQIVEIITYFFLMYVYERLDIIFLILSLLVFLIQVLLIRSLNDYCIKIISKIYLFDWRK